MAGFSKDTLSLPAIVEYRKASNGGRWEGACLACNDHISTAHLPQRHALDQPPRDSSSKLCVHFLTKFSPIPHSKCWIFGKTVMDCYWLARAHRLTHGRHSLEGLVWKPLVIPSPDVVDMNEIEWVRGGYMKVGTAGSNSVSENYLKSNAKKLRIVPLAHQNSCSGLYVGILTPLSNTMTHSFCERCSGTTASL